MCEKKCEVKSRKNTYNIEGFAEQILKHLEDYDTDRNNSFDEFFDISWLKLNKLNQSFAPFEREQAVFTIIDFVEKNCKLIKTENFDCDDYDTPQYEHIQISRNKRKLCLTNGYMFLTWKKTKFIVRNYFKHQTMEFDVYYNKKDEKKAQQFKDAFYKHMEDHNFLKGEKLVMVERGFIEFLDYPKLGWKDIILPEKTIDEFKLNLIFPLSNRELCKRHNIPWRRGLLLGGKAGTGKTQICRILCNELKDVTVIWATPKALTEEMMIQHLFDCGRMLAPSLIIIEDIDFIGTSRDVTQNPILGELLTQLDGNSPNDGVFVIATTNRPHMLDEALANRPSRFDIKIKFSLPNTRQRMRLITLFTKGMKFEKPYSEVQRSVTTLTDKLTGSHIKEVFIYSQLKALKRGVSIIKMQDLTAKINAFKMKERGRMVA